MIKPQRKKIIAVLKIRAMEKGEVIHRLAVDQVRQEKRIPAVIVTAKSLQHMYPLTFRYRYPISHRIKQVSYVLSLKIPCHL